jgi:hypothetical protein
MGMPIIIAFCLTAEGVRFMLREIVLTWVLFFECFFSSRTSPESMHAAWFSQSSLVPPFLNNSPARIGIWRTFAHRALLAEEAFSLARHPHLIRKRLHDPRTHRRSACHLVPKPDGSAPTRTAAEEGVAQAPLSQMLR